MAGEVTLNAEAKADFTLEKTLAVVFVGRFVGAPGTRSAEM